jgi:hypothetical protein
MQRNKIFYDLLLFPSKTIFFPKKANVVFLGKTTTKKQKKICFEKTTVNALRKKIPIP